MSEDVSWPQADDERVARWILDPKRENYEEAVARLCESFEEKRKGAESDIDLLRRYTRDVLGMP